jgi:hypothetical protein
MGVAALAAFFWLQGKGRLEAAYQQLKESDSRLAALQNENGRLSNLVTHSKMDSLTNASWSELLKLRGEVGLLRREMESLRTTQRVTEIDLGLAGVDPNIKLAQAEAILKAVQAQAVGETGRVMAIQMELADLRMKEAEKANSEGRLSKDEFANIKREIAEINHALRLEKLKVAQSNQDWSTFDSIGSTARAEALLAELNFKQGASDESEIVWRKAHLAEIEALMTRLNSEVGRRSLK